MSWCEVASILVTDGEAQRLLQTPWRCKSQAMLVLLCWLRGFTPECDRAPGRVSCKLKTPYSACPGLSCAYLHSACQNRDFFCWRSFKWVVALTVINDLVQWKWIWMTLFVQHSWQQIQISIEHLMNRHISDVYSERNSPGDPSGNKRVTVQFFFSFQSLHMWFTFAVTKESLSLETESCYRYVIGSDALMGCEQQPYWYLENCWYCHIKNSTLYLFSWSSALCAKVNKLIWGGVW